MEESQLPSQRTVSPSQMEAVRMEGVGGEGGGGIGELVREGMGWGGVKQQVKKKKTI